MHVTRDVILDLLPVYMVGEASPATRALVEDYLKQDPELARRLRLQWAETLKQTEPAGLPPEIELRSLKRTRSLLMWQRTLFGFALFFLAFGASFEFSTRGGQLQEMHMLVRDYPLPFGAALACSLGCWIAYVAIRRRVRSAGF
jgi:hypothetical protein